MIGMKRTSNKDMDSYLNTIVYLRDEKKWGPRKIGQYLNKDHSTIAHMYKKAKAICIVGVPCYVPNQTILERNRVGKYDHLFEDINRGSNYDYLVKKSDNLTRLLARLTRDERHHEN